MKKIFIVLVIMCLASVYSCNTKQGKSITTSDSTQVLSPSENLVRFFLKYKSYDANEVKEQMLIEKRDAELKNMMDSVGVFNNLEASINDINVQNLDNGIKLLSYTLSIFDTQSETEAWEDSTYMGFIELRCTHLIKGKDNYFLGKIAEIPDFSNVYIDGIFAIDNKTNMPKLLYSTSQLIHPSYIFHVTDISTKELSPISNNLKGAILAGRKLFDYTFMGKGNFDKKTNDELDQKFGQAKTGLNQKDSLYLIRYMNGIMLDSPY